MSDGTRLRDEFLLDPNVTFLNHGSFGATPRAVFERYQEWQLELERQPVLFLARRLDQLLAEARSVLGTYVGADPEDLVFVPNAGTAVNVAAWPLGLEAGDEVLSTDLEYGALDLAWDHVCRDVGARYVRTPIRLPIESAEEVAETIWAGVGPRTKVLYLSHYTSSTALILPVAELCRRARERGIRTIVDGAHVPGHLPLDLRALDPDYYAGNCHKWLCAPKGAAFLYVRKDLQPSVHPLMISWGYEGEAPTFVDRHQKQGTRDPAAYLTVSTALEWQREHDWESVRERCHQLARRARNELGLEPLTPDSAEFFRQMVTLRAPKDAPIDLQERLYDEYGIEIPVFERGDERFIRASFQGYNDEGDLERLKTALGELLA
ncbi:MAG: isopenicillin-N epimerase [Gaiellaceae bacterium]|nr:isopenicillin-N epimerase [Gaiellaceae bacterium]